MGAEEIKKALLPMNVQFFAKESNDDEELDDENIEDQDNQGGAGEKEPKGKDDKGKGDSKPTGKTFTQEQVNRMMTREKTQGRSAALKELGVDPKDSKMVAMVKALIESQKTDEQKSAEKQAEDATKLQEADARVAKAEAKAEAMQLGVKPQYVDDVIALVLNKMTEDADLKTLIGEYKTKYPIWFGESDDDEDDKGKKIQKAGQKGTGSSIKASGKDKTEKGTEGLGARLAAQRKGGTKKASYWG